MDAAIAHPRHDGHETGPDLLGGSAFPRGFGAVLFVSLALHGAMWAAAIHWPGLLPDMKPPERIDAITARIVKKGIRKPENALPIIETAPPPVDSGSANRVKSADAVAAPVPSNEPVKTTTARSTTQSTKPDNRQLLSVLDKYNARRTGRAQMGYGDPNGSVDGDADEAREGDLYLTALQRKVKERWDVPSIISDADRLHLNATVILYLTPTGQVRDVRFEKPSGNPLFDSSLEKAIRAAAPFGIPPAVFMARFSQTGIGLNFRPGA